MRRRKSGAAGFLVSEPGRWFWGLRACSLPLPSGAVHGPSPRDPGSCHLGGVAAKQAREWAACALRGRSRARSRVASVGGFSTWSVVKIKPVSPVTSRVCCLVDLGPLCSVTEEISGLVIIPEVSFCLIAPCSLLSLQIRSPGAHRCLALLSCGSFFCLEFEAGMETVETRLGGCLTYSDCFLHPAHPPAGGLASASRY